MAHNININRNGRASFFTVKEKAWHGLGQTLDECPTSEEAIVQAGLDFTVKKTGIIANTPDENVNIPNKFATYRDDTNEVFGVVGNRYTIVQNKDAFSFFDAIVGEGEAIYETAGALGAGEVVFITAKLPSYIKVGKGDDVEKYLLLTMSHNGSSAIQAMFTPVRVVCNNTLTAALKGAKNKVTIRHTKSAHNNLKLAHKVLGITNQLSDELADIFGAMSKTKLTEKSTEKFIEVSLGLERDEEGNLSTKANNIMDVVLEYNEIGAGQQLETTKGTLWGAYNAVTGYMSNVKDYKVTDKKMQSIIDGTDYKTNSRSLELAKSILSAN